MQSELDVTGRKREKRTEAQMIAAQGSSLERVAYVARRVKLLEEKKRELMSQLTPSELELYESAS